MEKLISRHSALRILSLVCILTLTTISSFRMDLNSQIRCFPTSLLSGCLILLFIPLRHEDFKFSIIGSLISAGLLTGLHIILATSQTGRIITLAVLFLLESIFISWRTISKYTKSCAMFSENSRWESVEEMSRGVFAGIFSILALAFIVLEVLNLRTWLCIPFACLPAALYISLYIRAWYGKTFFVPGEFEDEVRTMEKSIMKPFDPEDSSLDKRSAMLYKKIVDCMESEKPYLDDKFDEEKLARMVLSNVYYISRSINSVTGKNFRHFVNGYRVRYAIELIRKDPHLRVIEVAMMSGFCSTSTFNVAFKDIMKMTPNEYIKAVQAEAL